MSTACRNARLMAPFVRRGTLFVLGSTSGNGTSPISEAMGDGGEGERSVTLRWG